MTAHPADDVRCIDCGEPIPPDAGFVYDFLRDALMCEPCDGIEERVADIRAARNDGEATP